MSNSLYCSLKYEEQKLKKIEKSKNRLPLSTKGNPVDDRQKSK